MIIPGSLALTTKMKNAAIKTNLIVTNFTSNLYIKSSQLS